ncbi:hypothetical protein F5Y12DRAFT_796804 [Xylaria sp. FL1777]|nr:hypothetical protein F5Y12DRAFT_796804 [Xylaria sp. FL1777]
MAHKDNTEDQVCCQDAFGQVMFCDGPCFRKIVEALSMMKVTLTNFNVFNPFDLSNPHVHWLVCLLNMESAMRKHSGTLANQLASFLFTVLQYCTHVGLVTHDVVPGWDEALTTHNNSTTTLGRNHGLDIVMEGDEMHCRVSIALEAKGLPSSLPPKSMWDFVVRSVNERQAMRSGVHTHASTAVENIRPQRSRQGQEMDVDMDRDETSMSRALPPFTLLSVRRRRNATTPAPRDYILSSTGRPDFHNEQATGLDVQIPTMELGQGSVGAFRSSIPFNRFQPEEVPRRSHLTMLSAATSPRPLSSPPSVWWSSSSNVQPRGYQREVPPLDEDIVMGDAPLTSAGSSPRNQDNNMCSQNAVSSNRYRFDESAPQDVHPPAYAPLPPFLMRSTTRGPSGEIVSVGEGNDHDNEFHGLYDDEREGVVSGATQAQLFQGRQRRSLTPIFPPAPAPGAVSSPQGSNTNNQSPGTFPSEGVLLYHSGSSREFLSSSSDGSVSPRTVPNNNNNHHHHDDDDDDHMLADPLNSSSTGSVVRPNTKKGKKPRKATKAKGNKGYLAKLGKVVRKPFNLIRNALQ